MTSTTFYYVLAAWVLLGGITFFVLLRARAPYGRHRSSGWGPEINHRVGWFVMEVPAAMVFLWMILTGDHRLTAPLIVFACLWQVHYVNRSIIFPLRMTPTDRTMPLLIVGSAIFFNVVNGYLNGYYLGSLGPEYGMEWLRDPRFALGATLFAVGFGINLSADNSLLRLRREAGGYKIPRRGLFEYVSCPNYFGEIIEWIGFAVLTWAPAAAAFAIWTAANLVPRAMSNHKWYHERFDDYPSDRKALVPFVL